MKKELDKSQALQYNRIIKREENKKMTVKIYFDTEEAFIMEDTEMNIFTYVMNEISEGRHFNAIVVNAENDLIMYEIW